MTKHKVKSERIQTDDTFYEISGWRYYDETKELTQSTGVIALIPQDIIDVL